MRYLYVAISLLVLSVGPLLLSATMGKERKNIIVCIGDSLTEGGPGHYMTLAKPPDATNVQYCDVLRERLPDWKVYTPPPVVYYQPRRMTP